MLFDRRLILIHFQTPEIIRQSSRRRLLTGLVGLSTGTSLKEAHTPTDLWQADDIEICLLTQSAISPAAAVRFQRASRLPHIVPNFIKR